MAVHEVPSPGVSDARPPRHTRFEPLAVPKDDDSGLGTQAVPAKDEVELELLADGEFPLKSVIAVGCVAEWAWSAPAPSARRLPPVA
jgi:hypothetical protein